MKNPGPGSQVTGAGNLTVSPFILQWKERKVGSFKFVQRAVLDFDLPTGKYDRAAKLSLSSHAFDIQPTHVIWIGANGYYLTQITNPKLNGMSLSNSPERVGSVGPEP